MDEAESAALTTFLDGLDPLADDVVSSVLLETELRRVAVRTGLSQTSVSAVLDRISLADSDRSVYLAAGLLPDPTLRGLGALHLATALRLETDVLLA